MIISEYSSGIWTPQITPITILREYLVSRVFCLTICSSCCLSSSPTEHIKLAANSTEESQAVVGLAPQDRARVPESFVEDLGMVISRESFKAALDEARHTSAGRLYWYDSFHNLWTGNQQSQGM